MENNCFSNSQCFYYSYLFYYSIKRKCFKIKRNLYQCICPINNDLENNYELQEIVIINNDNTKENLSKKKSNSSQEEIYKRNEKTPIVTKQPQKQIDNSNELEKPKLKRRNAMKIRNNIMKKEKEINIKKKNKIKLISVKETIYENEVSYTEDKEEDKDEEPRLRKLVKKKNKKNGISSSDEEEWDII
tara:strand:+ start:5401 stop:5964 length:564 start_codon:yes stop_codon:yes gene_type:complete